MTSRLKAVPVAAAVLAALVVGTVAIAGAPDGDESAGGEPEISAGSTEPTERADAGGRDDDVGEADEQVKDRATSDRARAAALRGVGDGTVTEVERAHEGQSGYEVEVKRSDGSYAEVALDRGYGVVSVENDAD